MKFKDYVAIYLCGSSVLYAAGKSLVNFSWYFIPLGLFPYLFAGLKWNQGKLSVQQIAVNSTLLFFVFFIVYFAVCYLIHFCKTVKNNQKSTIILCGKEAGLEVASVLQ